MKLLSYFVCVLFIFSVANAQTDAKETEGKSKEAGNEVTKASDDNKKAESKENVSKNGDTNTKKETKKSKKKDKSKMKAVSAEFHTSEGNFKVELYPDKAPETVENFAGLAEGSKEFTDPKTGKKTKRPFYDGLIFHRVIEGFMLQGGCPLGNGTGGPGYKFKDEFDKTLRHDQPGMLSMANAGPGTNGSQFFVTVAPTPHLNDRHSIFGKVIEGLDVVMKISKTPTGRGDKPIKDIVIKNIKIERK